MPPFGGLPGGNHADRAGLFRCRLCSLISPEMQFTPKHKRSSMEKTKSSCLSVIQRPRWESNFHPRENMQSRHAFIERAVPAMRTFSSCCALKEFLQFVKDERQWRSERGRQTDRQRGREILDAFSTLFHFSLAPRGFSKAFSRRLALIFQSLSVPVLCLLYTLPSKYIFFSFSSSLLSLLHPTSPHPAMWAEGMIGLQSMSVWICTSRDVSLNPLPPFFPIGSSLLWRTFASSRGYTTGLLIYH